MSEKSKKPIPSYVIVIAIICVPAIISIAVISILEGVIANQEIKKVSEELTNMKNQLTLIQNTTNNLNSTSASIIKYINERNEPFIQNVIKYANDTNIRLDKLEK